MRQDDSTVRKADEPKAGKLRFFVWSPEGLTEPRVLFTTHKQAMRAAYHMAEDHAEQTFFVVRTVSRPIHRALAPTETGEVG